MAGLERRHGRGRSVDQIDGHWSTASPHDTPHAARFAMCMDAHSTHVAQRTGGIYSARPNFSTSPPPPYPHHRTSQAGDLETWIFRFVTCDERFSFFVMLFRVCVLIPRPYCWVGMLRWYANAKKVRLRMRVRARARIRGGREGEGE